MPSILQYVTPTLLLPLAALAGVYYLFVYYWRAMAPRDGTLEWVTLASASKPKLSFSLPLHPMERKDMLPVLLLTAVYAFTAFFQLGSLQAPQSFAQLGKGETVELVLDKEYTLGRVMYYPGLNTGSYMLEVSTDGRAWKTLSFHERDKEKKTEAYHDWADKAEVSLTQKYSELFKWNEVNPKETARVKYIRLTAKPDSGKNWLELGELALYDENGRQITPGDSSVPILDEIDTIPKAPNWYNSAYFDEIYHPRTAYEHIRNVYPYEITHPPLGKLIMSLGVRAFGMTPFGWRFTGTLFGVLMVPLLYLFLKNLFGKTIVALCGAAFFTFDFMHLTQTRIGTIDTYGVFFVLAMYYFMYRYLTLPAGTSFQKGALPLFLSGLMWGLGAASKWTVIYGAVGLALLYFVGLYFKWRDWPGEENAPRFGPWLTKTLLFSVLCFVIIPGTIYTLSYIPYAAAVGEVNVRSVVKAMLDNQKYMLNYHKGVTEPHPYASRWYQWIVNGRPILYYLDTSQEAATGLKTAFGAFHNPIAAWAGLVAMVTCGIQVVRRRCGKAMFIVVGYLSQLVPWMFIFRPTFAYHYFPSVLFLAMALAYVMNDLVERKAAGWKWAVYGTTGVAVGLYAAFYPVLIGLAVPNWYTTYLLRWLPSWPF